MKGIDFDRLQDETKVDAYLSELYANSFTVAGSIEYITAFSYAKWPDCQVGFYTISHFNGARTAKYNDMVNLLYKEAGKNHIKILDLWHNDTISAWKGNLFCLYMDDLHHPKKAGYLQWTPFFERAIVDWMPPAKPVEPADPEEPEQPEQPGQSDQPGEHVDPGDSGGGNDSGDQKDGTSTDGDTNGGSDGSSDSNGGSDGGSDGNGGSDGDSNGGESESNDDITSIILSWLRAA